MKLLIIRHGDPNYEKDSLTYILYNYFYHFCLCPTLPVSRY